MSEPGVAEAPLSQWDLVKRLMTAFLAGLLVGGVSIGQIAPRGLGSDTQNVAFSDTGGAADPFNGGGSGDDIWEEGDPGEFDDPLDDDAFDGDPFGDDDLGGDPASDPFAADSGPSAPAGPSASTPTGPSQPAGPGTPSGSAPGTSQAGGADRQDEPDAGSTAPSGGGSTPAPGTSGGRSSRDGGSGGSGGSAGAQDSGGSGASTASGCTAATNGGETDRGVTANSIRLATTTVDSGIGRAFLGDVKFAMEAVRQKVNRAGGICGRQLQITYRDDGWDAQRGAQYLRNFISEGVFAVPVGPSSEGLNAVINSGDADSSKTPIVGTDGLIISQYQKQGGGAQPWVWPVAVATVQSARIMAKQAYDSGAREFSVVFDSNYRFGQEGARAFNSEVKRLTGSDIKGFSQASNTCAQAYCGVIAGQSSYSSQVNTWRNNRGDFTALFLEPQTALTWMNDANTPAASQHKYGGAQPLFTRSFAENCKARCDQMHVWTGFKPFIEQYRNDPSVQTYVNDLKAVNPNADATNQFVEGGYVGMRLLVSALTKISPNVTRDRLKQALDTEELTTGLTLTPTLRFSANNRYVATGMQAWKIEYKGSFGGWTAGPVVTDPRPTAGEG